MPELPVLSSEERTLAVAAGKTDTGRRRKHNEDRILVAPELGLFAVADGMGGHQAGDVASAIAAATLEGFFRDGPAAAVALEGFEQASRPARQLVEAVLRCNRAVYAESGRSTSDGGMGSTLVALRMSPEEGALHVAHVGDSRCYRIRDGVIEQLTEDHSARNEARRRNPHLPKEVLDRLPSNVVTRALGMKDDVLPDVRSEPLRAGDVYVLCSDGLSGLIKDEDILFGVQEAENLDAACELLVTLANEAGGRDNVSVVLVRVEEGAGDGAPLSALPAAPTPAAEAGEAPDVVAEEVSVALEMGDEARISEPIALAGARISEPIALEEPRTSEPIALDGGRTSEPLALGREPPPPRDSESEAVIVAEAVDEDEILEDVLELTRPKSAPPARLVAPAPAPFDPLAPIAGLRIIGVGEPTPEPVKPPLRPRAPCPGCGHRPLPHERFCGMCGANLEPPTRSPRCKACGTPRDGDARFCVECGVGFGRRRVQRP